MGEMRGAGPAAVAVIRQVTIKWPPKARLDHEKRASQPISKENSNLVALVVHAALNLR